METVPLLAYRVLVIAFAISVLFNVFLVYELLKIVRHFLALQSYAYYAQYQAVQQQEQRSDKDTEQDGGLVIQGFGG